MSPVDVAEALKTALAAASLGETVTVERTWLIDKSVEEFTGQQPLITVAPVMPESVLNGRAGFLDSFRIDVAIRSRAATETRRDQTAALTWAVWDLFKTHPLNHLYLPTLKLKASPFWAPEYAAHNLWFSIIEATLGLSA